METEFKYIFGDEDDMPEIKLTSAICISADVVKEMMAEMGLARKDRSIIDGSQVMPELPMPVPGTPSLQPDSAILKTSLSVTGVGPISHSTPLPHSIFPHQMVDHTIEEEAPPCAEMQRVITVVADVHRPLDGGDKLPTATSGRRFADMFEEVSLPPEGPQDPLAIAEIERKQRKERQDVLIQAIKDAHAVGIDPITLDEVAPKPLNRPNAAATFGDLLYLCKKRYVDLVSEPQSLELSHLLLGPKLQNF